MSLTARSFFHPTSKAYFDKIEVAGGNVSDKNSVNNFVEGLSRIIHPSLWVCWPLRSSQNIGTGTTAYSLGGLGNFNATLTSGPTWGSTGLTIPTVGGAGITISSLTPQSFIYVGTNRASGGNDAYFNNSLILQNSSNILCLRKTSDGTIAIDSTVAASTTVYNFIGTRVAPNDAELTVNGVSYGTDTAYNSYGAGTLLGVITSTASFFAISSGGLSTTQLTALYALYKSTIGQGLGLQ